MDVLIFAGQSNMQGSTGEKCYEPKSERCFEYKYLTDKIVPLISPVGENISENVFCASAKGNGSLVPYFCREYCKSGKKVLAIHVAKGDTAISQWQKGTERFELLIKKVKAGINKAKDVIENIYFIWLQGESDALNFTGTEKYLKSLIKFKGDLKREIPITRFAIIRQGYFCAYADWVKGTYKEKKSSDKAIMRAFNLAVKTDKDFIMLTKVCAKLSVNKKYLNGQEFGPHYNNKGMKIIGKKAAKQLLKQEKVKKWKTN